jgi:hypothetical protein
MGPAGICSGPKAGWFPGDNTAEPDAGAPVAEEDVGAINAGPPETSFGYWAWAAAVRQKASDSTVNNALNGGIERWATCACANGSAILGPFSYGRQIFKWRDKISVPKSPAGYLLRHTPLQSSSGSRRNTQTAVFEQGEYQHNYAQIVSPVDGVW